MAYRAVLISGEGDIGTIYQTNVYHTKSDEISEWNSFISPTLTYSSQGSSNNLIIDYNPTYSYNHRRNVDTLRNNLNIDFIHQVSSKSNFIFSNNFYHISQPGSEMNGTSMAMDFVRLSPEQQVAVVNLLFYDIDWPDGEFDPTNPAQVAFVQTELQIRYDAASPEIQAEVDGIMQQSTDDNTFWGNTASFTGFYQHDRDNLISFGYTYNKLKNDADYLGDDEYHQPFISLQHNLTRALELLFSYTYTDQSRELSGDSTSHDTSLKTTYLFNHGQQVYLEYRNEQRRFDGTQSNQVAHRFDIGYYCRFNPKTTLDLTAKPFRINRYNTSNERGYGLQATLSHNLKNSHVSLEARNNFSELDTTGSWKSFRQAWLVKTNFDHRFNQDLNTDFFLSYGQNESWYNSSKSTYSIYTGGLDTTYSLNKWLDITLEYRYTLLNSDNNLIDDATNNKITLKVSAANDFWRW